MGLDCRKRLEAFQIIFEIRKLRKYGRIVGFTMEEGHMGQEIQIT